MLEVFFKRSKKNLNSINLFFRFMKMLDIVKHGHKQVKNLSGGTKRKLAYAITLFGNRDITLLDGTQLIFI